jgi:hypothetical protein
VSRDVVFEEFKSWNWNGKEKNKTPIDVNTVDNDEGKEIELQHDETIEDQVDVENNPTSSGNSDEESSNDSENDVLPIRTRQPPEYLRDYVTGIESIDNQAYQQLQNLAIAMFTTNEDLSSYDEASKHNVWKKALDNEIESIEANDTWELTTQPKGVKAVGVKWIFKTKYNEKGNVDKHKARLVAKGYTQRHGIDYNEVFAPVARWDTIRAILSLAAHRQWGVYQLDVKSAFIHGDLTEHVYVEQPVGYHKGGSDQVYKLKKALYGLKQAPRAWYSKIESYFNTEQFDKCPHEPTLFVKHGDGGKILIVSLHD